MLAAATLLMVIIMHLYRPVGCHTMGDPLPTAQLPVPRLLRLPKLYFLSIPPEIELDIFRLLCQYTYPGDISILYFLYLNQTCICLSFFF